jgi:hypothetical protein
MPYSSTISHCHGDVYDKAGARCPQVFILASDPLSFNAMSDTRLKVIVVGAGAFMSPLVWNDTDLSMHL